MIQLRKVTIAVLGHVDHGKSTLLDTIRNTTIVEREAGKITQAIGTSIIPIETVKRICGKLLDSLKIQITIPGFLAIDTPGHAAFTSLRKRGGTIADIAILVVDINQGFQPQTLEAIEILKTFKVPFVVVANKIDLIHGWSTEEGFLLQQIQQQQPHVKDVFEKRMYELVGKLYELGFQTERFDRLESYTKQIAIVPCSAKIGTGIPELLMVLTGLAQKYLEQSLKANIKGPGKGTILEVKEEKGLGSTIDVILYDGMLKQNDIIVIGGINGPIVTKIRALFEPKPLSEMKDIKAKYQLMKQVVAATGVKISAPMLDKAVSGMPIRSCSHEEIEQVCKELQKEVSEVLIETEKEGVVLKADTLGSLEALNHMLKERGIPIMKASIGPISKKDMADAEANKEKTKEYSCILGFNIPLPDVSSDSVKIFINQVIYKLVEDYEAWVKELKKQTQSQEIDSLIRPSKVELLKGYVFRQLNPAVVGSEILAGVLRVGVKLMKEGKELTSIKGMQAEKENIQKATRGMRVAISMEGVTVGRQIKEGDVLYTAIPESDFRRLKELKDYLSAEEIEVMKEIAAQMREHNPVWGI